MIIPDQSHINRVRDALWQRPQGRASVMIGAGFSRNARKAGPDAREPPLWTEVAKILCGKLYPPGDSDRAQRANAEASGTSGFLRLAQEYEVAFGRDALHHLVREVVPDEDFVPGDMHSRLLHLPWRDVFTTNWDTLLERTRSLVPDRDYSMVRTIDGISSAVVPRIVKLHGSFPDSIPFVFTEEDYRTYPQRFAPFVNMVQQAMMETVVCLIGFSGDDPNFLHWSGWVRDNLGKSAPKIYLAGWLDLSPHRRRMLEDRNVVPIDLARHPKAATWPDHLRHRNATDWLLYTLERGRPYDVANWPTPPDWSRSPIPEHLQPVEDVMVEAPIKVPMLPSLTDDRNELPALVRNVFNAWKRNRQIYPGWMVIPTSKYLHSDNTLPQWEPIILGVISTQTFEQRLFVIRELIWWHEHLSTPITENLEVAAQAVLDHVDCHNRRIDDVSSQPGNSWSAIREAWREIALTLLTTARHRLEQEKFDQHLEDLKPFANDTPDVAQRIYHERCLWSIYELDYASLDILLKEWKTEGEDPAWMLRKAGILAEINRNDEAVRLLNCALSAVRAVSGQGRYLARESRESWILWLALAYDRNDISSTEGVVDTQEAFSRWQQLAPLECDAFAERRALFDDLQGERQKEAGPLFDLGMRRGLVSRLSNAEYDKWCSARRAIRLSEVVGLPPVIFSDILSLAVERLTTTDQRLAARLALRLSSEEDCPVINRVFSRSRVASMQMPEVLILHNIVIHVIDYALRRVKSTDSFWGGRLTMAMEVLSRLALRLPPEVADDVFKRSLIYYRTEDVAKRLWTHRAVNNLLNRSWEALPRERKSDYILDILNAPIVGLDGFLSSTSFYPDPANLLNKDFPVPPRSSETDNRWTEVVQRLVRGLTAGEEARKRAAPRLAYVALGDCLMEGETQLVAAKLWHSDYTPPDDLPRHTSLLDWAFLLLPEPTPGLAEQRFRRKWLSKRPPLASERTMHELRAQLATPDLPEVEKYSIIGKISQEIARNGPVPSFGERLEFFGRSFGNLRLHRKIFILSDTERGYLIDQIAQWTEIVTSNNNESQFTPDDSKTVNGLEYLLLEIEIPPNIAEKILQKIIKMEWIGEHGFRAIAGLAKSLPSKLPDLAEFMRIGLASDQYSMAESAVYGLTTWVKSSLDETLNVPSPPNDLVREVGIMIATRRKSGVLNRALQLAQLVFSSATNELRIEIAQFVEHGLGYLIEELKYERGHGEDVDVPLLRWGCVHLALAMEASGFGGRPAVMRWVEAANNDPLPEVRYAKRPVFDLSPGNDVSG